MFHGPVILERLSIDQCDGCGKVEGGRLFAQELRVGTERGLFACLQIEAGPPSF